jgi:xylan 1,4-beta-xylosidase
VEHFRVDDEHSNAYEAWKKMGSPAKPSTEQYAQLEAAGQLQSFTSPRWILAEQGRLRIPFALPLHGVSLIRLTW